MKRYKMFENAVKTYLTGGNIYDEKILEKAFDILISLGLIIVLSPLFGTVGSGILEDGKAGNFHPAKAGS